MLENDRLERQYSEILENTFIRKNTLDLLSKFALEINNYKDLHQLELFLTKTDIEQTIVDNYEENKKLTNFENTKLALFSFLVENKALPVECEKEYFSLLINKNRKSLSLV